MKGIVVGCDAEQEWLLPWWWQHYAAHNDYPVLFADFGLSPHMRAWCQGKGELTAPIDSLPLSNKIDLNPEMQRLFQERYGERFWVRRQAWFKKPVALQLAPFEESLWLDADCQVLGNLTPLFASLSYGIDGALARDREQHHAFQLPGEVHYNSGVIAFRKGARLLTLWEETARQYQHLLPGDQEALSRAIYLHELPLSELSPLHNWYRPLGENPKALIVHYCGGPAKVEILARLLPRV